MIFTVFLGMMSSLLSIVNTDDVESGFDEDGNGEYAEHEA